MNFTQKNKKKGKIMNKLLKTFHGHDQLGIGRTKMAYYHINECEKALKTNPLEFLMKCQEFAFKTQNNKILKNY